jgi:threonylcarbamoyladenosine tRNA methylthiotransferase MtaB
MKVAFFTLGCKVNQNDSDGMAELFRRSGHTNMPFAPGADVYVVNTCVVTKTGEQKSRQIVRRAAGFNPEGIVVVVGCYAQTAPGTVAGLPGVALVVGMADRSRIVELVEKYRHNCRPVIAVNPLTSETPWTSLPISHETRRTRAFLKIEDGCEEFCSYCIVPYARGRVRSMPPREALAAFNELVAAGYREIVVTGIHLGCYGRDLDANLAALLQKMADQPGNFRIRLGSLEPLDINKDLIALVTGHPKICRYLHIPLQSGHDRILREMNRRYDTAWFARLLAQLRTMNPLISIGTDLIVGFPGETDADFEMARCFVATQQFSRIHVFRFSPRCGTPAAELSERVPRTVQEERSRAIRELAVESECEYMKRFMGRTVETVFEKKTSAGWEGLSGEYLRIFTKDRRDLADRLCRVAVTGVGENCLIGGVCDDLEVI